MEERLKEINKVKFNIDKKHICQEKTQSLHMKKSKLKIEKPVSTSKVKKNGKYILFF